MLKVLMLIVLIAFAVLVSLYTGKTTFTGNNILIERPLVFVGSLLSMLGIIFILMGIAIE